MSQEVRTFYGLWQVVSTEYLCMRCVRSLTAASGLERRQEFLAKYDLQQRYNVTAHQI